MINLENYDRKKLGFPHVTSPATYRIKNTNAGYKVQQKFFIFWFDRKFMGSIVINDRYFQTFEDAKFALKVAQIVEDKKENEQKTLFYY